ncbi:hypothetical protein FK873_gp091 [Micromonas pusilla virus SP1]|uniref:Major capsid protein n=1 Tax=Micromonas pusilla virus SP1 TaxID=373996 RepID=G9E662_MPSP1|nr:hypothetical protein FK873_gp091 [Micromonas pusilla virus SP1]AET84889.1 hypothetical protein MPXG_00091 [Micromonas pusilla virus SP1]
MENIEQTVNGTASDSGRVSVTVARNGDLVGDMYVELKAKSGIATGTSGSTADACWVAERAIASAELSIGGQRVDKHYQKWWRLYSELYLDESKKLNWGKMTTAVDSTVFLPLIFFFNRNPGLALPLIALQYHEVRIDFDLTSQFSTHTDGNTFKVWANYLYLDTEERRRFAQKGHEYLIEQVQHTGVDSVTASGGTKQVRLSYNHPVKELVWCLSENDDQQGLWNFTTKAADAEIVLESDPSAIETSNVFIAPGAVGAPLLKEGTGGGTSKFTEEAVGTVAKAKLVLNGQDRFKEQSGKYFNQVQSYQHHSGAPYAGIYSYSFALKPEEHQPTGTCNFSRIDNAQMSITTTAGADNATNLNMFAVNYNVLRIQSGMGGLAFSN